MSKAGKRILQGAREALAFVNDAADLDAYVVHVPKKMDLRALRKARNMTQEAFAIRYGFNVARLRDWEQGRSQPDGAARAYLKLIEREPEVVERVLADAS